MDVRVLKGSGSGGGSLRSFKRNAQRAGSGEAAFDGANRTRLWSFESSGRGKIEARARSIRSGLLTLDWGLREQVSLQARERPVRATGSRVERASGESANGDAATGKTGGRGVGGRIVRRSSLHCSAPACGGGHG
jgi:hypothetical protein